MAILTTTARTILKSRLRRHADALLIAQHIEAEYGASNVSALNRDALLDTAAKFGVPLPTEEECAAYANEKNAGHSMQAALGAADSIMPLPAKVKALDAPRPAILATVLGSDDTDTDMDTDEVDTTPAIIATTNAPVSSAPGASAEGIDPVAVDAEVKAVMAALAGGDFVGYQLALKGLAERALKPAVVHTIEVPSVDLSKVKGRVPVKLGAKDMKAAGIGAPTGIRLDATALPFYDAHNAPKVDNNYHWPEVTGPILSAFRRSKPVFVYGPAGSGKTEFAKQVAARWGRPFVRISCDDQTEAQTLVGMTVPDANGGTKWQDGQLTAAIRVPGTVILIDEPSVARPGALFVLQAVMDDDRRLHIAETGEVVPVAPDVVLLLADNTNGTGDITGQYEATRRLNRATLDRPALIARFDYMSPVDEAAVIHAKTGLPKKAAAVLAKFGALTRAQEQNGKVSHGVGLRRLIALAELLVDGVDATLAYQLAVIEGAPYDDKEPLRQFWTADVGVRDLNATMKAAA